MLTLTGNNIRVSDTRHKFDNAISEYLFDLAVDGEFSRANGDDDLGFWWIQFGKRILLGDNRGFVWCEKCATVAVADEVVAMLNAKWENWQIENFG